MNLAKLFFFIPLFSLILADAAGTAAATVQNETTGQEASITVGAEMPAQTITPLLGVNAGPTPQGEAINVDVTSHYQKTGVTMVRTHDLYGPLDMSLMYPDRTKDPSDAASYNFTASDAAFDAIISGGFEPYFRIGDSYNNVSPPATEAERANWAAAAAYIVGRYLKRGSFRYVEILNEPDNSRFWPAPRTRVEFFDLYARTGKAIKAAYPGLKVGGPAFTQNVYKTTAGKELLDSFLSYVEANGAPLDFLSWHCYSNAPADFTAGAAYIRRQLDANGFTAAESHISEWNTDERNDDPVEVRLGAKGSAILTSAWIALVKAGVNQSLFYRGNDTSLDMPTFYGLFYANGSYKKNAHAFSLWARIAAYPAMLGVSLSSTAANDASQISAIAGKNSDGRKALLLANVSATAVRAALSGLSRPITLYTLSDATSAVQESTPSGETITIPAYGVVLAVESTSGGCTFTLSPSAYEYNSASATGSVTVTASAGGCSWTAVGNDSWISIRGQGSGAGSGSFSYSLTANTSQERRVGTMTIGGRTFTVIQNGTNTHYDTVQKAYIGYYQRPADPGGLIWWAGELEKNGGSLGAIIEAFANSVESQNLYGKIGGSNISQVVNDIYLALFNREADSGGLGYYVEGFNRGQFTAATIMLNVLYGAQNDDLVALSNKVTAANRFTTAIDPDLDGKDLQVTYAGEGDAMAGRNFLSLVGYDPTTIPSQTQANEYLQAHVAP